MLQSVFEMPSHHRQPRRSSHPKDSSIPLCALVSRLLVLAGLLLTGTMQKASANPSEKLSLLDDSWGFYLGSGFSGATSGRPVPGLHLSGHLKYVNLSLFTSGVTSEAFSESHQIVHLGFPFRLYSSSWFEFRSSLGLSGQQSVRKWHGQSLAGDNRQQESLWGLGQAVEACLYSHICLRLEGLYGLIEQSTEQIFQETALGSIGVSL